MMPGAQRPILRERLRSEAATPIGGIWVTLPDPALVEIAAAAGCEFVIVDLQHTAIEVADLEDMARAAMAHGIYSIARISDRSYGAIGRVLDTGVDGILAPMIATADEVRAIVAAALWPPHGKRSFTSATRAGGYGTGPHLVTADPFVAVQIETADAVANLAEIVRVPHLDLVFPSTSDLRGTIAGPNMSDAETTLAVERALATVTGMFPLPDGPTLGMAVYSPLLNWDLAMCRERGVRLVVHGSAVRMLGAAVRSTIDRFSLRGARPDALDLR